MSNAAGARGFWRRVQSLKATLKGSPDIRSKVQVDQGHDAGSFAALIERVFAFVFLVSSVLTQLEA
jgi:hypothetical protein